MSIGRALLRWVPKERPHVNKTPTPAAETESLLSVSVEKIAAARGHHLEEHRPMVVPWLPSAEP